MSEGTYRVVWGPPTKLLAIAPGTKLLAAILPPGYHSQHTSRPSVDLQCCHNTTRLTAAYVSIILITPY